MKFMRQYLLSLLLVFSVVSNSYAAADLGNTSVISPTDASNGSGTCPSWLGSAAPSTLDDAGRCLQGAIAREWQNRSFAVTSSGTAPTFVVAYTVAPAAYRTGQVYSFIAHAAAVGSETANINTLGAKNLKKVVAGVKTALAANDFYAGDFLMFAYDGTDLVWIQPYPNAARTTDANTFAANQTITSTDADTAAGPIAILHRNSATPAASDVIGQVRLDGEDSAGNQQEYAAIEATIADATTTEEDGSLDIYAQLAGTRTRYLTAGRNAAGTFTANAIGLPLGQLSFPATQNASSGANTLDDYEEGTFTPGMTFNGDNTGVTYSTQTGKYIKVGKHVTCWVRMVLTNNGSGVGIARINGLPFTSADTYFSPGPPVFIGAGGSSATGLFSLMEPGVTTARLVLSGATTTASATDTNITNTFDAWITIIYEANN